MLDAMGDPLRFSDTLRHFIASNSIDLYVFLLFVLLHETLMDLIEFLLSSQMVTILELLQLDSVLRLQEVMNLL